MQKQRMSRIHLMSGAILIILIPLAAMATEIKGTPEELKAYLQSDTRTVTMRDSATEKAYTDIAKITLIVVTESKSLASAIQENSQIRSRVRASLIDAGISDEKIRSAKYSASPQFGWFGKAPSSFEIVNSIVVEVADESHFRRVSELADTERTISFGNVKFEHSEKQNFENLVRDRAVETVLENVAYFERRLGLTLHPVAFKFSDVNRFDQDRDGQIEEIIVTANRSASSSAALVSRPVSFDEIEYRASVEITFEVERKP